MKRKLLLLTNEISKRQSPNSVIAVSTTRQKDISYSPIIGWVGMLIIDVYMILAGGTAAQAQWTQQSSILPGDGNDAFNTFPIALSSDGQTLAAGAPYNSTSRGQVKVYKRMGTALIQLGDVVTGDVVMDYAGSAIALSSDGQTLAVGAYSNNGQRGQVKVYKLVNSAWIQQGNAITGINEGDFVGSSVSLSSDGQTLAVGAPRSNRVQGQVKVYSLLNGAWTQQGNALNGDAEYDYFGFSVLLSSDGQTLAVGAVDNSSSRGQVKVYRRIDGIWTQLGSAFRGDAANDKAGWSLALSSDGQTLAFGALGYNSDRGQVKAYKLAAGVWTQLGSAITGNEESELVGTSLALSSDGQTLAVGASGYGNGCGQVKVYTLASGVWTQQGSAITGDKDVKAYQAGRTVALSSDGQTLAVGAMETFYHTGGVKVYRFCNLPVSIIPGSQTISAGNSLTLTATGADIYNWSNNQSTSTITVSPASTTTYSVTGTSGVCSAMASDLITVLPATESDLTPTLFARPAVLYGSSTISLVIDVDEIKNQSTTTPIVLKITRDANVSLYFTPTITSIAGRSVQNSLWSFNDTNSDYYVLTSSGVIPAGGVVSLGLEGMVSPGSTAGSLTISATLISGDRRLNNNVDAEKIEYFQR